MHRKRLEQCSTHLKHFDVLVIMTVLNLKTMTTRMGLHLVTGDCRDHKSYNKKRATLRFASTEELISSWHAVGAQTGLGSSCSMNQVPNLRNLSLCFVVLNLRKRCVHKL